MKCQVLGKVKLAVNPFLNQWWQVAFQLNGRGLTTGLVPWRDRSFEATFDLRAHRLQIDISDGAGGWIDLTQGSLADFHAQVGEMLTRAGITVNASPSEVPRPVSLDEQRSEGMYDPQAVTSWWTAMGAV